MGFLNDPILFIFRKDNLQRQRRGIIPAQAIGLGQGSQNRSAGLKARPISSNAAILVHAIAPHSPAKQSQPNAHRRGIPITQNFQNAARSQLKLADD